MVGAELNYLPIKKLAHALITSFRGLRHYFDNHPIKFDFNSHEGFSVPI